MRQPTKRDDTADLNKRCKSFFEVEQRGVPECVGDYRCGLVIGIGFARVPTSLGNIELSIVI